MFTGLIEKVGSFQRLWHEGGGAKIAVGHDPFEPALDMGESVAVQGVCLSVSALAPHGFVADLLEETLRKTTFRELAPGAPLNLERALRADSRIGGHFVSGHIDETGHVLELSPRGRDRELLVRCSESSAQLAVLKGSIAINGVSLTITGLGKDRIAVHLVPVTLRKTSLGFLHAGDGVHLEADLLGKYVHRFMNFSGRPPDGPENKDVPVGERLFNAGFYDG